MVRIVAASTRVYGMDMEWRTIMYGTWPSFDVRVPALGLLLGRLAEESWCRPMARRSLTGQRRAAARTTPGPARSPAEMMISNFCRENIKFILERVAATRGDRDTTGGVLSLVLCPEAAPGRTAKWGALGAQG